ncbi:hypothetical protein WDH52_16560 [Streptomyces sp. TRM70308]|uniref:hypothetical protein n=1 Tax=Streptomyces sp. TRM70308 TaxID=3131932 RepID=UPI003D019F18
MPALQRLARTISRQVRHGSPVARRRHTSRTSAIGRSPHGVTMGAVVGGLLRAVRGASSHGRRRPHGGLGHRARRW